MIHGIVMLLVLPGMATAQTLPYISVHTDLDVYGPGQTIHVDGLVGEPHGGAVTIRIVAPNDAVVAVGQVMPQGRDWSWDITAEFGMAGTYTIKASYVLAGHDRHDTATFIYDRSVGGVVRMNGTSYDISYAGDPILAAYTDPNRNVIYLEFEGPAKGVMRVDHNLYQGISSPYRAEPSYHTTINHTHT